MNVCVICAFRWCILLEAAKCDNLPPLKKNVPSVHLWNHSWINNWSSWVGVAGPSAYCFQILLALGSDDLLPCWEVMTGPAFPKLIKGVHKTMVETASCTVSCQPSVCTKTKTVTILKTIWNTKGGGKRKDTSRLSVHHFTFSYLALTSKPYISPVHLWVPLGKYFETLWHFSNPVESNPLWAS